MPLPLHAWSNSDEAQKQHLRVHMDDLGCLGHRGLLVPYLDSLYALQGACSFQQYLHGTRLLVKGVLCRSSSRRSAAAGKTLRSLPNRVAGHTLEGWLPSVPRSRRWCCHRPAQEPPQQS